MNYFHVLAKMLQDEGRGRDTILAHITPAEAKLLKSRGGRGSVNPVTGLLEFDDGPGGEGPGGEGPGGDASDNSNSNSEASAQDAAGGNAGQGAGPTGAGAGSTGEQGPGPDDSGNAGGGDGGGGNYYYPPSAGGGGGGSSAPAAPSFATSPGFLAQLAAARNIPVPQVSIASNYRGSYAPDLSRVVPLGLLDVAPVMPVAAQAPVSFGGGGLLGGDMFGQSSLAPISQGQVYGSGAQAAAPQAAFAAGGYQPQPVYYEPSTGGISYEEFLRQQRGY